MTKREQYKLEFSKMKMVGFSDSFICTGSSSVNGSLQLANLLDVLSDKEFDLRTSPTSQPFNLPR